MKKPETRQIPLVFLTKLFNTLFMHPKRDIAGGLRELLGDLEPFARIPERTVEVPFDLLQRSAQMLVTHPWPERIEQWTIRDLAHPHEGPIRFCEVFQLTDGRYALAEGNDIPLNMLEEPEECLVFP